VFVIKWVYSDKMTQLLWVGHLLHTNETATEVYNLINAANFGCVDRNILLK